MIDNMKKALLITGLFVGFAVLGFYFIGGNAPDDTDKLTSLEEVSDGVTLDVGTATQRQAGENGSPANVHIALFDSIANQLNTRFADRLGNAYWRAKMVSDLILLFKEKFPDTWQQELEAFFNHAYPKISDDLMKTLLSLLEYNHWLGNLKSTMEFASIKERQAALWEKRVALFGDQAYEIWEAAHKNEQLQDSLVKVDNLMGDFSQKVTLYIESMQEVFGEGIVGEGKPHATQMMTKFLDLDGVQVELQSMRSDERYAQLREFRESMGLDDAALDRWDTLDQKRDDQWATGASYMEARVSLSTQYQGAEFNEKLTQYQNDIFGEAEAKYIRNEESSGYFRFEQTQKYGIN